MAGTKFFGIMDKDHSVRIYTDENRAKLANDEGGGILFSFDICSTVLPSSSFTTKHSFVCINTECGLDYDMVIVGTSRLNGFDRHTHKFVCPACGADTRRINQ